MWCHDLSECSETRLLRLANNVCQRLVDQERRALVLVVIVRNFRTSPPRHCCAVTVTSYRDMLVKTIEVPTATSHRRSSFSQAAVRKFAAQRGERLSVPGKGSYPDNRVTCWYAVQGVFVPALSLPQAQLTRLSVLGKGPSSRSRDSGGDAGSGCGNGLA
ncbi:hypothetical protein LSAT2_019182 [Lamellibrachia satsuma]|nr:hypothetical protein LSAT2_019182 [Lamellibrachia satsuma]